MTIPRQVVSEVQFHDRKPEVVKGSVHAGTREEGGKKEGRGRSLKGLVNDRAFRNKSSGPAFLPHSPRLCDFGLWYSLKMVNSWAPIRMI